MNSKKVDEKLSESKDIDNKVKVEKDKETFVIVENNSLIIEEIKIMNISIMIFKKIIPAFSSNYLN